MAVVPPLRGTGRDDLAGDGPAALRRLAWCLRGGPAAGCAVALDRWRTGGTPLPDELQRLHDELWQRVRHGDTTGVVRLLEAGFPPVPDHGGTTLMHALDEVDHERVLPVLLRLGLDVNARTPSALTPLHFLLRRGRCSNALIEALVRAGADPRLRDADGHDAYRRAGNRPHLHAVFDRGWPAGERDSR
ncbi:hypothetical protein KZZ52_28720 [Dactylosporangium sp. AC04546]|uniref:ankyrin repeat domain-containing protein n=1 Tax=Dactylosporangium sp. AC04546 TaxID=2862460 RepID=UPI001EDF6B24|nr:hypothetical protein [Dactylosporangium sp. AC04546]WVK89254.1 hypothetical protein KZZ52_28720 [Dactylosporangium sp. AC04546]